MAMVKFLFNLPESQLKLLRDLSIRTEIPVSEHIRSAIVEYFDRNVSTFYSGGVYPIVSGNGATR